MAKFTIESKSNQSADITFEKIKNFLEKDPELKKLDPKLKCDFDPKKLCGEAKGGQFKAIIKVVSNGTSADVIINVDLALILTPFKGKVQEILQKKLTKALA
jgi:hypothetical protein